MSKSLRVSLEHRQRGATLVVAMIFLIVLALLGVAAVKNNTLQERMSGNTRDRDIAFQAAELALRDAYANLATIRSGTFDGSSGLFTYDANAANDATYWNNSTQWTSYKTPALTLTRVAVQPRYRVDKKPSIGGVEHYRVTARGVGASSTTVVILQAEYTYTP